MSRRCVQTVFWLGVVLCLAGAPFLGGTYISPLAILEPDSVDKLIFWQLRLPRVLGAFLTGASLSLAGLSFQALFRNPLATPFTLGVSSGAALGASLWQRWGAALTLGVSGSSLAALSGSLLAIGIVFLVTTLAGGLPLAALLLAGVMVNFFFSSLVMFVQYISNAHDAVQILRWLMGSLAGLEFSGLLQLFLAAATAFCVFAWLSPELDLLLTGEEIAASRGVNVRRVRLTIFFAASGVTAVTVSVTGPIGFVGLMIPQVCRLIVGHRHAALVPAAFFGGGAFLVLCDLLARSLLAPAEIPIGIITSMLGAPFFLWLLYCGRSSRFQARATK